MNRAAVTVGLIGFATGTAALQLLLAGIAARRARRAKDRPRARGSQGRVLLVRPCAGRERFGPEALASTIAAGELRTVTIRFGVADTDDPAISPALDAARSLRARGLDAEVVVTHPIGPNRKVGQLAAMADAQWQRFDTIVVVDSDVALRPGDLRGLVDALHGEDRLAAVWVPPVEVRSETVGDRASAAVLGASLHAFPLLGTLDRNGLVGKTFAIRADALHQIGGFGPLRQHLGEDMELARRLRAHGWRTRMVSTPVYSLASTRSLRDVLQRYARWIGVMRTQRPWLLPTYPLLFASTPLAALAVAALSILDPTSGLFAAMGLMGSRVSVAVLARKACGVRGSKRCVVVDVCLADLLLLAAFVRGLGSRRVQWRGRGLRLGTGGRLEPDQAPFVGPEALGSSPSFVGRGGSRPSAEDAR